MHDTHKTLVGKGFTKADNRQKSTELTFFQILTSVLAAAFGVQTRANLNRDLSSGRPTHFIIAGILFAGFFVLSIIGLVNWVLANS